MLLWIWVAVVVLALIVLGAAAAPLLGKLGGLRRAAVKLQGRQAEALRLRQAAATLEQTLLGLQRRAETTQDWLAAIRK